MTTSSAGPRRRWTLLFLALGGYSAALLTFLIHEIVGHGVVALLVGGRFFDAYVSPLGGSANTSVPPSFDLLVSAGGAIAPLLVGALAHRLVRRRLDRARAVLPTALLWLFACEALVDSLAYMTFEPLLASLTGLETGDWLAVSRRLDIRPALLSVVGALVLVPVAGGLMSSARRIVERLGYDVPSRLAAYWLLLLPGVVLLLSYLAALAPWSEEPLALSLGSILGVPALGVAGLAWPRDAHRPRAAPISPPGGGEIARWSTAMVGFAAVVAVTFGPTSDLRRGVFVHPPDGDQYVGAAQELRLEIRLASMADARVRFRSSPLPDRGSPFRRRLTTALLDVGPSVEAATRLSEFIATWNLDGLPVQEVTEPLPTSSGWTWEASLSSWPDSTMIRLWPVTWVRDSRIVSVQLEGAEVWTFPPLPTTDEGGARWTRPDPMVSVDSFYVRVGAQPTSRRSRR